MLVSRHCFLHAAQGRIPDWIRSRKTLLPCYLLPKKIQATEPQTVCVNTRREFPTRQDVLVRSTQAVSRPHEFVLLNNYSLNPCVILWLHNTDTVVSMRHVNGEGKSPHECRITKYSTWPLT